VGTENFSGTFRERFWGAKRRKSGTNGNYILKDSSRVPVRRGQNRAGNAKMLVTANIGGVVVGEVGVEGGVTAFRGRRDMYTRRRMGVI